MTVQSVLRASGILREFSEAGVLAPADVHVAVRLQKLAGQQPDSVLLATALATRAVRLGSVCVDLHRLAEVTVESGTDLDALPWPSAETVVADLRRSTLVTGGEFPLRPLRLVDTTEGELLYLDRYYRQEQSIRRILDDRAQSAPSVDDGQIRAALDRLFHDSEGHPAPPPDRQRVAAALAATQWTTLIAGGPGTGKTHTVARILALLYTMHGAGLRAGLAAPTGKAAARLEESINEQSANLALPPGLSAMTLHRLLGWRPGSRNRFRHDAHNRLPYDVIVLDETSMVSLTMMCRLLEAVRPDARLVLVGDPDQLTSVEAGAVLADLVARPETAPTTPSPVLNRVIERDINARDDPSESRLSEFEERRLHRGVIRLSRGRRFGGNIARLASAVRDGQADDALGILHSNCDDVSLCLPDDLDALRADTVDAARAVTDCARAGDIGGALAQLEGHRLLCAHRDGPFGVQLWAQQAMDWVSEASGERIDPYHWYPGQPLLVTENDHDAKVYNGDTGVVVARGSALVAAFQRGAEPLLLHPNQLASVQTVYAMTIHRSQGSQYDTVSVLLPESDSLLLTRELLYTAITRARRHVRIVGTEDSVCAGIARQVQRASGLRRVFT
ncbi:exodeoxyribonuclease V subunit alpha [Hoyosella sp. YIM 151337]|uniref:exodeoxyribonuclease V subunit alpha n=1 Tax=Hoyosella sp. YIM 151337 TaxID=2992742 RepID=UPI002235ABD2|nr:exodeoxyribonuclease V subunit alpha [Hoyosella sp. YIM 151337]MCW4354377.1 exodeoxyribonuclease V subunit alpha [Hoyosella sp. YIM 151337]